MTRYCSGDAAAFDTLYFRHKGPLYRYLRRQAGAKHADELFQDIWLKIVKSRQTYYRGAKFTTFLYTVAHRRVIDHYRLNNKAILVSYDETAAFDETNAPGHTPALEQPEREVDRAKQLEKLLKLIDMLPAAQREAFLLHEESGLSIDEIATATDVKPETAKSRIRYAIRKLREGLQSD